MDRSRFEILFLLLLMLGRRTVAFAPRLLARDISCADIDSNLPSSIRCPSNSNCISLDSSSSALCCPNGSDCSIIQTIPCDVSKLNPVTFPNATIFTTKLTDTLPACGTQCCPFGYICGQADGKDICKIDTTTSHSTPTKAQSATTTSASTTSTTSATATPSASSVLSSSITTNSTQPGAQCDKFPAGVFLAGFFPGIVIGAFIVLAWVILSGRHRAPESPRTSMISNDYPKLNISAPIPSFVHPGSRSDFLRRTKSRARSIFSLRSPRAENTDSWKMPTPPIPNNIPSQPAMKLISLPKTPERTVNIQHAPERSSFRVSTISPSPIGLDTPGATVPPLRVMAAQRNRTQHNTSPTPHMGSPFQTPPAPLQAQNMAESSINSFNSPTYPAYNGLPSNPRPDKGFIIDLDEREPSSIDRPGSSFTAMLSGIGFPDPMKNKVPKVPPIPNHYR